MHDVINQQSTRQRNYNAAGCCLGMALLRCPTPQPQPPCTTEEMEDHTHNPSASSSTFGLENLGFSFTDQTWSWKSLRASSLSLLANHSHSAIEDGQILPQPPLRQQILAERHPLTAR